MARGFCPKCGHFSFAYDPSIKLSRCYNRECGIVDKEKKYGEGLSSNPFVRRGPDGLVIKTNSEND